MRPAGRVPAPGEPMAFVVALRGDAVLDWLADNGTPATDTVSGAATAGEISAASERVALASRARAAIASAQSPARTYLAAHRVKVISTYDAALTGFLVLAAPGDLEVLEGTPGAAAVYPAPRLETDLQDAVPVVGADEVAAALGYTGEGANVAILDTGIDYTHANLGGSGNAMDYAQNNPGLVEPDTFPTTKVVGGYDFAGSMYGSGQVPSPDDDPLDQQGHGTHVASIAAGVDTDNVAHGVAPGARLVALKVFGSNGSTDLVLDGIEWAIEANLGFPVAGTAARVDVLNMSLGTPWADGVMEQLGVVQRAVEAGIVVVASSGNSGATGFVTGSPAAAPMALSVASTIASGGRSDLVRVTTNGDPQDVEALESDSSLSGPISVSVTAEPVDYGQGCAAGQHPPVAGKVALIARGGCTFKEMLTTARAAGAVAVLVYTDSRPVIPMGTDSGRVPVPAFMVSNAAGRAILQSLTLGAEVTVQMSPAFRGAYVRTGAVDSVSSFSSRGPGRNGTLKPNLAAPGSAIRAAGRGSGDGAAILSGTSMASPMVAGGAAVLVGRLRDEGVTVSALDTATMLVNTAHPPVWQDSARSARAPLARGGAGRLAVDLAARTHAVLMGDSGEPFAVDLGMEVFEGRLLGEGSAVLRNLGNLPRRFAFSAVQAGSSLPGVTLQVIPAEALVPAGASVTVVVSSEVDAAATGDFAAHGGECAMADRCLARAEVEAHLAAVAIPDEGVNPEFQDDVRLPIYMLPRPLSNTQVAPLWVSGGSGVGPVTVEGIGAVAGRAELFHLLARDTDETALADALDVDIVGVRVVPDPAGRRLDFLVHTRAPRRVPIDARVSVVLDVNANGEPDKAVFNYDVGMWLTGDDTGSGDPNGEQGSIVAPVANHPFRITTDASVPDYYADVELDSGTVILSADAIKLGFADGTPIVFDAVILVEAAFADVAAGGSRLTDAVPDDGFRSGSLGNGRIHFDERTVAWAAAPWSVTVGPGLSAQLELAADPGRLPAPALVSLPWDGSARDLLDTVVSVGAVPTPSATDGSAQPTASATETATQTATDVPSATPTWADITGTPPATPTATQGDADTPTTAPSATPTPPTETSTPDSTATTSPTRTALPSVTAGTPPTQRRPSAPQGAFRLYCPLVLSPSIRR